MQQEPVVFEVPECLPYEDQSMSTTLHGAVVNALPGSAEL